VLLREILRSHTLQVGGALTGMGKGHDAREITWIGEVEMLGICAFYFFLSLRGLFDQKRFWKFVDLGILVGISGVLWYRLFTVCF